MTEVVKGRHTAEIDGDFVVFMIGMRANKIWKVRQWLRTAMAMPRMQRQLAADPDLGLLAVMNRGSLSVQYWRSFEHLERFARNPELSHLPAWREFNKAIGSNGDVGIWHETYLVKAGQYETLYNNMPVFGLAEAGELVPVARRGDTAAVRAGRRQDETMPVPVDG